MTNTEKLDKYLSGELSSAERKKLEIELESNSDLQSQLNTLKMQKSYLKTDDKFKSSRNVIQNISDEFKIGESEKPSDFKLIYLLPVAVAASLLVALFVLPLNVSSDADKLFRQHYQPASISLVEKGTSDDELRLNAQSNFNSKNYTNAEKYLTELSAIEKDNLDISFYLAIAKIGAQDYNSAISLLKTLEEEGIYSAGAKWYIALANLELDNQDEAKSYLNQIPESSSYYSQARTLLQALK